MHEVNFSMTSIAMCMIFSTVLICLLYLIIKHYGSLPKIHASFFSACLGLILIRLLVPIELPFTKNIYLKGTLGRSIIYFCWPYFHLGKPYEFSIEKIFRLIWFLVSGILIFRFYLQCRYNQRLILLHGVEISFQEPYSQIAKQYALKHHKKRTPSIYLMPKFDSALMLGILHPCIIIPEENNWSKDELELVLYHELQHYYHHDIWKKTLIQLVIRFYWWFVPLRFLPYIMDSISESYVDSQILKEEPPDRFGIYLESVRQEAKKRIASLSPTAAFSMHYASVLHARCKFISKAPLKIHRSLSILLMTFIIAIYIFSSCFIFEPASYDELNYFPPLPEGEYLCQPEFSYVIIHKDGTCTVVMDGQVVGSGYPWNDSLKEMKTYYE
ncbi:MAG: hypothetical protein K6E48_09075 [Lachnospiraceae bacterium]|nr:hypothetical protein [Lachnospiraceae bacterium]